MFTVFERTIALRYLRARRANGFVSTITLFSFLGITLGVATLIVVMSVMNGFHRELMDKILGTNGHAFVQSSESPFTHWAEIAAKTAVLPGVKAAIPMVVGASGVSSQFGQTGALVRGVREQDISSIPGIDGKVRHGTLRGFDQLGGVAIGHHLAETLGVVVGDKVSLLVAKGSQTPFGVAPRIKSYPVVAIFQTGMSQFDSLFVYMPFVEAQMFFNKENEATVIEVFVKDPETMDAFRMDIGKAIARPLIITDWRQQNKTFFDALRVEKNVLFIILALIVVVASFNIVSGLTMLVRDKTQDIGILRTMGATHGAILRIFFLVGASIGCTGTLAGFLVGLVLANNLEAIRQLLDKLLEANLFPEEAYFLSQLPSIVDPREIAVVVGMALLLACLASIYPAWKAASLDPIDALRHE